MGKRMDETPAVINKIRHERKAGVFVRESDKSSFVNPQRYGGA
jgi:hypothetical protein